MATMGEPGERPRTGGAEPAAFGPAPRREQLKGHASMLTSVAVHISGLVLYKDLVADTPATQMVATQLVIGALLLWLIAIATRQPLRLRGPLWRIVLLGSLAPVSIFMFMAFATVRTSATNATIIFGLVPVMLPVLGWLVLGERLRLSVMLGATVAFSGIVLIVWHRAGLGSGDPFGDMLMFLTVMCVCATQLTGRRVNQYFGNAVMVTTYQVTVSAFIATIAMLLVHPPDPFLPGSAGPTYGKLLYLVSPWVKSTSMTQNSRDESRVSPGRTTDATEGISPSDALATPLSRFSEAQGENVADPYRSPRAPQQERGDRR